MYTDTVEDERRPEHPQGGKQTVPHLQLDNSSVLALAPLAPYVVALEATGLSADMLLFRYKLEAGRRNHHMVRPYCALHDWPRLYCSVSLQGLLELYCELVRRTVRKRTKSAMPFLRSQRPL